VLNRDLEWFLHDNKYWISRFSYKDLPHRSRAGLAELARNAAINTV